MSIQPCKRNCDEVSAANRREDHRLPQGTAALYVHIPFCLAKCRYCDFYSLPLAHEHGGSSPSRDLAGRYVDAAIRELSANRGLLSVPLVTIFIGGGTPTAIGAGLLGKLLEVLTPLRNDATEFSVEANPGAFDADIAATLRSGGANRLNFGVQSFQPSELATLGRIHDPDQAQQAFRLARASGFENIGLDLIYAIPGQTLATWKDSLARTLGLGPQHLSCYALSFERGTPLHQARQAGQVAEMDESLQRECYDLAIEQAATAGLDHYEISNFARSGRQCRHNLTYWRNESYLGIGPAAASFLPSDAGGVRKTNSPDLQGYLDAIAAGRVAPCSSETLPLRARMAETLMLGLRLMAGVNRAEFAARFGVDPVAAFPISIGRYLAQGALLAEGNWFRLARQAYFASDTVLADIIAEAG